MTATAIHRLTSVDPRFIRTAAIGGLLGGAVLFAIMAGYDSATGMGAAALLNACFAAFVFPNAGMSMGGSMREGTGMGGASNMSTGSGMANNESGMHAGTGMAGHHMMANDNIVASHLAVGSVLHVAMSVTMGIAFALVLAFALRAGLRALTHPLAYLAAGAIGGAILYTIMMYAVAPAMNSTINDMTARAPFFWAHIAFGVVVAGFVYLRRVGPQEAVARVSGRSAAFSAG